MDSTCRKKRRNTFAEIEIVVSQRNRTLKHVTIVQCMRTIIWFAFDIMRDLAYIIYIKITNKIQNINAIKFDNFLFKYTIDLRILLRLFHDEVYRL